MNIGPTSRLFLLSIGLLLFFSCDKNPESPRLFTLLNSNSTGINFSNDVQANDSMNILSYMYFYNGGGVAVGDVNNDGMEDLYFSGNQSSSKLYLNKKNLSFEDATEAANAATSGWCTGVAIVDINQDGWNDIYVCKAGHPNGPQRANVFLINQGDGTFENRALEMGLADTSYSTQATFLDYDKDGDLDVFILNHTQQTHGLNNPIPLENMPFTTSRDRLYENTGLNENKVPRFVDVSDSVGIVQGGFGLGVAVSDFNGDHWPDIYVSNDFISSDQLYLNNQKGGFTNEISSKTGHQSHNGMGVAAADLNNDGHADLLQLDMLPPDNYRRKMMVMAPNKDRFDLGLSWGYQPQVMRNTLQLNRFGFGEWTGMSEVGQLAGIQATDWSWAPVIGDFDLDGQKDIFITNGYGRDITDLDFIKRRRSLAQFRQKGGRDSVYLSLVEKQPTVQLENFLFRNKGDLQFEDVSKSWGITGKTISHGAVCADLDGDGDLDLVVNNQNQKAQIYRNNVLELDTSKSSISFRLLGEKRLDHAIGARVEVVTGKVTQTYDYTPKSGYQSSSGQWITVGIDTFSKVDAIRIHWPNGDWTIEKDLPKGSQHYFTKKDQGENAQAKSTYHWIHPVLIEDALFLGGKHQDKDQSDFKYAPLLPHYGSKRGPGVAVGDVDQNGFEDMLITQGVGFPDVLVLRKNYNWTEEVNLPGSEAFDSKGALFFDADGDGDVDLYVVGGGALNQTMPIAFRDRFYRNDGQGNFREDPSTLQKEPFIGSCVNAADFDKDGDLDLFVGDYGTPNASWMPTKHCLLMNEGGNFRDVTDSIAPGFERTGSVSTALWTDYNNDGWVDLIMAGHWTAITVYENQEGKFVDVTEKCDLSHSIGWWNSLNGVDMDQDGDIDLIAGNWGQNNDLIPQEGDFLQINFPQNESSSPSTSFLSHFLEDEAGGRALYPMPGRDVLLEEYRQLEGIYPAYSAFAQSTTADLTKILDLTLSVKMERDGLASAYLENLGDGTFKWHPLPIEAQFAPVFGMVCRDLNNDSYPDVLLTGNFHHNSVDQGPMDASNGLLLLGDGNGGFNPVVLGKRGFVENREGRALCWLSDELGGKRIVSSPNGSSQKAWQYMGIAVEGHALGHLDAKAHITYKDGRHQKVEFYYGCGYLSQNSRRFFKPENASLVEFKKFDLN